MRRGRGRPRLVACPQCKLEQDGRAARWCGACGASLRPEELTHARASSLVGQGTADERDDGAGSDGGRAGRLLAAAVLVGLLAAMLVTRSVREPVSDPAGYTARGDSARTGTVSTIDPAEPTGEVWSADVALPPLEPDGTRLLGETATPDGDALVVLTPAPEGQRIAVHDRADGELLWTTMLPLGSQPWGTEVGFGMVAHRTLTSVTLLDLAARTRRWTVPTRLRAASAVTAAGVVGVIAETTEPTVVLLGGPDGAEQWRWELGRPGSVQTMYTDGDVVVVGVTHGADGVQFGLDVADGTELWAEPGLHLQPTFPTPQPVVDGDQVVTIGDGTVDRTRLRDGMRDVLRLPASDDPAGLVSMDADDGRVVTFDAAGVVRLQEADGTQRWSLDTGNRQVFGVELAGGVVAVHEDSLISLHDATSGDVLARVTQDPRTPRATLLGDGSLASVGTDAMLRTRDATGPRWAAATIATHLPDLVTADGNVALVTPTGVEVRSTIDGVRRWSSEAFDQSLVAAGSLTGAALVAGRVIVAPPSVQPAERGGARALFTDTGIVSWARTDDRVPARGTPIASGELVWLPVGNQLLGFDPTDGVRRVVVNTTLPRSEVSVRGDFLAATDLTSGEGNVWVGRRTDRRPLFMAPIRTCVAPSIVDDVVLLNTHDGDVVARTLLTGEQPFGKRAGGSVCRPLTITDDAFVALVDDRDLLALSLDDDGPAWRMTLPSTAAAAPVRAGDVLLVPTLDGLLRGINADTGEQLWSYDLGGPAAASVAVDGDVLIVLLRDGRLVGLR